MIHADRDALSRLLVGAGCLLIVGAPLLAAASCAASSPLRGAQAPRATAPTPAPPATPAAPHSDTQDLR